MPDMRHRTARKVAVASDTCLMTFLLLPFYIALAPFIAVARAVKRRRPSREGWDV
jgi:hypothetical protein